MSPEKIEAALEASRRFELEAAGATFSVRLPSEYAWNVALQSHNGADGKPVQAECLREIVESAITGWEGVTLRFLIPDAPDEPLPFDGNVRRLLEHNQDIVNSLAVQLSARLNERRQAREDARKNSERASTGT